MHIVLVHGAWHGAWCWDRVVPELQARGHDVVAVELPGHGERASERPEGLADYRDAVLDALAPDTVLVGHSMGGVVITHVADAAPERIRRLVYLTAFAPSDGQSLLDLYGGEIDFEARGMTFNGDGSAVVVPTLEVAMELFYADCAPADAAWAFRQFVPQPIGMLVEPVSLPRFDEAAIPRTYGLCLRDGVLPPDLQRRMAARLGVEPAELDTAHSPWLNRPADVARLILRDVQDLP